MPDESKRPARLDLSKVNLELPGRKSDFRLPSSSLSPRDTHSVLQKSRQIALQQRRIIGSAITPSPLSSTSSPSSASVSAANGGSTFSTRSSDQESSTATSSYHNDVENNHNGPGRLPSRKRMRRNAPPQRLRIPSKSYLLREPVQSAPIDGVSGRNVRRRIPMVAPMATPMAMQRGMQAMQPMRIPGRPGYIMMVPMVAQTPVTVKGGTVQPTVIDRSVVDDVYMDALNRKIASKGREDGEQQEGEAAEEEEQEAEGAEKGEGVEKEEESDDDSDSDDVEAKAIEEGAANQPDIIRGVLQISNKAYNYSVAVTGDEDEDRKHFHDVMEVVWKNYMK